MHKTIKPLIIFLLLLLQFHCGIGNTDPGSTLQKIDAIQLNTEINSNRLKVIKKKGGAIEELEYTRAITENAGTAKEKKCLCQAVAFRIAQLASQAWKDKVFRSYEVVKIRTGWNTDGPYEFFSDKIHNGETGDLEIPAGKIWVQGKKGGKPTGEEDLTIKDAWYEITLANGTKLSFTGTETLYAPGFLELRWKFKHGDRTVLQKMRSKRKEAEHRLAAIPFKAIRMQTGAIQ